MKMIPIRYVGTRESWNDYLYGSNVTWNGHDDIQMVPEEAAQRLLKHPEFVREELLDEEHVKDPPKKIETEEEPGLPPLSDISNMTKAQIAATVQKHFGVVLDPEALKKDALVEQFRTLTGRARL